MLGPIARSIAMGIGQGDPRIALAAKCTVLVEFFDLFIALQKCLSLNFVGTAGWSRFRRNFIFNSRRWFSRFSVNKESAENGTRSFRVDVRICRLI